MLKLSSVRIHSHRNRTRCEEIKILIVFFLLLHLSFLFCSSVSIMCDAIFEVPSKWKRRNNTQNAEWILCLVSSTETAARKIQCVFPNEDGMERESESKKWNKNDRMKDGKRLFVWKDVLNCLENDFLSIYIFSSFNSFRFATFVSELLLPFSSSFRYTRFNM